jgi:hypothetical protein
VAGVELTGAGFRLRLGPHLPAPPAGPACLTFHAHPAMFTGQENHTFVGEVAAGGRMPTTSGSSGNWRTSAWPGTSWP